MHSQALATSRAAGRAAAADAAAARADAQVAHSKMAARTAAAAAAQLTLSRDAAASGRSSPVRMPHAPQPRSESPSATLGRLRAELSASLRGEAQGRVHLPWDGPSPGGPPSAPDASGTAASAPRLLRVPTAPPLPPPLRAAPHRAGLAVAEAESAASFADDLARWGRPHAHGGPASASSYGSSHSEGSSRHGSNARAALQGAISDVLGSMARVRAQSPQYRPAGGARQRM